MSVYYSNSLVTIDLSKIDGELKVLIFEGDAELEFEGRYATFQTKENLEGIGDGWAETPIQRALESLFAKNGLSVTLLCGWWSSSDPLAEEMARERYREEYESWWEGVCAAWEVKIC